MTDLLAKGDEISLAMLINKIQTPEDVSAFVRLPGGQIDHILRDTPAHLLDIISKVFRALLYSMNLPEDDVEDAVSRIKERKMGRLFENVTMDIQAERRNAAEARAELSAAQRELETVQQERVRAQQELDTVQQERVRAQQELDTVQQERDTAQQELDTAQQERDTAQHKLETVQQERDIYRHILVMSRQHNSGAEILESLRRHFALSEEQAKEKLEEAFKD